MFIIWIAVFTAASLLVGLAQSAGWLVAARALQGVGAAILAPSTLSMLQTSFEARRERTRAVAWYGSVAGIGAGLGLVLGGVITTAISWRVAFFINVPVGLAMILAAPRFLPETGPRTGKLDIVGALSSWLGMTALVYGIVRAADAGWTDPITVGALVVGVVLLAPFVLNERRASQPIMPLRLFARRERSAAYGAHVLFLGGMMGFWFLHHPVPPEHLRLEPAASRSRLPTDDRVQLRGRPRRTASHTAVRKRTASRRRTRNHHRQHVLAEPTLRGHAVLSQASPSRWSSSASAKEMLAAALVLVAGLIVWPSRHAGATTLPAEPQLAGAPTPSASACSRR
jgi:MFS transporter